MTNNFKTATHVRLVPLLGALLAAALLVGIAAGAQLLTAAAPVNGNLVLSGRTLPRGAVWINDGTAATGHWWISDGTLGLCRVDAPPATTCNATVKTGGQLVVGTTPTTSADKSQFIYITDATSKSVKVVRFLFNYNTATLGSSITMSLSNVTSVGGGAQGGRPVGLALAPNDDLYIGYLKSGDIMRLPNAKLATSKSTAIRVGTTSDGIGINSLLWFGNDLYIAEAGGLGLSKIPDPSGLGGRPACSATAVCKAGTLAPEPSVFPGGLATDGTSIYIGDAPTIGAGSVLQYNPATGAVSTYSTNIEPYTSSFDNQYRTQYFGPTAVGYRAGTGELWVGDDPTYTVTATATGQGNIWSVPAAAAAAVPTVTGIAPTHGPSAGGNVVTVTGTGFVPGVSDVYFGTVEAALATTSCTTTRCTATSPAGLGTVDVTIWNAGQTSAPVPASRYTYDVPPPSLNAPVISSLSLTNGATSGGTLVTVTGSNFAVGATTFNFGPNAATSVTCTVASSCTMLTPAGAAGAVDVFATAAAGTGQLAAGFTYVTPSVSLYAWGLTAPGGVAWLPGALGGHWWTSDHAQGLCRQDDAPTGGLHAIDFAVCADDSIGSPGQVVLDPRPAPVPAVAGASTTDEYHYIYVPDNAVKSVAVWRQTFDATTETMVGPAERLVPLADIRTLKPDAMALGPLKADGSLDTANAAVGLYVGNLADGLIRRISGPDGDTRLQTIATVAQTLDAKGINGTIGFIGSTLYLPENRGATSVNVVGCPGATAPCATKLLPLPAGIFAGAVATDPAHGYAYVADAPGGAAATIYRVNAAVPTAPARVFLTGATLPGDSTVYCGTTCTRPWDYLSHPSISGPTGFSFVGALAIGPNSELVVTEDPWAGNRAARGSMWIGPFVP
jgi:hypothetical protein